MIRYIVIKTEFEAIHCWPDCPFDDVDFLRYPHRHVFHVTVKWKVQHDDRDKEFIMMKRQVEQYLKILGNNIGSLSCEQLADKIHWVFPDSTFVSVFEDNENGAEVIYE